MKKLYPANRYTAAPEMLRLLESVESGAYEGVLCMDIDRLGRWKKPVIKASFWKP